MTCAELQNRWLALPDPRAPGAILAAHAAGCPECAAFGARLAKLDALLPQLPVPPSNAGVKAAFTERILLSQPVIVYTPAIANALARRGSTGTLAKVWRERERWQYVAGVAAVLLVAVGLYWGATPGRVAVVGPPKPRHDLLSQNVKHLAALTRAETTPQKIQAWSELVTDLHAETKLVFKVAQKRELDSLERMYQKAVHDGLVAQAAQLPNHLTPAERREALRDATARLAAAEAEDAALADTAPGQSKATLKALAQIAKSGRAKLEDLARRGA